MLEIINLLLISWSIEVAVYINDTVTSYGLASIKAVGLGFLAFVSFN